ncbi:MAG TPA: FAD binding domain-containing protein [Kiritimatiellia bacterium]|nr:FAD binding domain-containing protein [Kiritimatiellia bacterium]
MKLKDYLLPGSLDEAKRLLRELGPAGLPVAGATSHGFLNVKEERVAVDLSRAGLAGITATASGWRIGAMTPIEDLYRRREKGWVLDRVADAFVSQQIRNVCTLGGNIARVFPWSDFPVVLLALDGTMRIAGEPDRSMGADEFFKGQPARHFQAGELLEWVEVSRLGAGEGFAVGKQKRTEVDFSQATAAVKATVAEGKVTGLRIALGAAVAVPTRLPELEAAFTGQAVPGEATIRSAVEGALDGLSFRSVAGMSRDYIAVVARVMTGDALVAALAEAGGGK